jgi:hypothetical protein
MCPVHPTVKMSRKSSEMDSISIAIDVNRPQSGNTPAAHGDDRPTGIRVTFEVGNLLHMRLTIACHIIVSFRSNSGTYQSELRAHAGVVSLQPQTNFNGTDYPIITLTYSYASVLFGVLNHFLRLPRALCSLCTMSRL